MAKRKTHSYGPNFVKIGQKPYESYGKTNRQPNETKIELKLGTYFVHSWITFVLYFISQKGDIINVISMCTSGLWRGYLAHDEHKRIGTFKFINVQLVPLETSGGSVVNHYTRKYNGRHHGNQMSGHQASRQTTHKHRPKTLEQLLRTIDMEVSGVCIWLLMLLK